MKFLFYSILLVFCFAKNGKEEKGGNPGAVVYSDSVVTNFFKREKGHIAGDGGFSVPLSNGKVLWLMGDSHMDDYDAKTNTVPCLFQVRNAAMLQPLNDWNSLHTATLKGNATGLKNFLKNNPVDDFFCWPGAGIQLQDTAYVYCSSFRNQGTGAFGFASTGNDFLAKIKLPEMTIASYKTLQNFNEMSFGIGFIKDSKTGWVYVYGQKYIAPRIECDLYLARFSANKPNDAWQFWDGKSWSMNVSDAKIIAAQAGVSGTFQVSKIKNKYLLLSSQLSINCDSGTEIYSAVSDYPGGPFSEKKLIYSIPDRKEGHSPFFYAAIAHPEYINAKNELLVTYAINGYGTCVQDCNNNRMNPDVYRLKAIRVPHKLLVN